MTMSSIVTCASFLYFLLLPASMAFRRPRRKTRAVKHGTAPQRPTITHSSYDMTAGGQLQLRERQVDYAKSDMPPAKRPRHDGSLAEPSESDWVDVDSSTPDSHADTHWTSGETLHVAGASSAPLASDTGQATERAAGLDEQSRKNKVRLCPLDNGRLLTLWAVPRICTMCGVQASLHVHPRRPPVAQPRS